MRLISSDVALREVLALSAADYLSLTDLAHSVENGPSAAQRALEILTQDGIAERSGNDGRPRYRLATTSAAVHIAGLARAEVSPDEALAISARANPAIEFLARSAGNVVVVFAANSRAGDEARAARFIDRIATDLGSQVDYLDHDDARRKLLDVPVLRTKVSGMQILYGSLDRSFPDRSRHAVRRGARLGRPHPALKLPSRHALRTLGRRHRLVSLKLFGSAVRSDFRSDSDVDALIRFRPGVRPTVRSMASLEADLERMFQRDVEITREEILAPETKAQIDREAVPLL
jgi:predicted nucleotidyltransferase